MSGVVSGFRAYIKELCMFLFKKKPQYLIVFSLFSSLNSFAFQDGYGNKTPSPSNTGNNYQNLGDNPYWNYSDNTLNNPYSQNDTSVHITNYAIGVEASDYRGEFISEEGGTPFAYNFEGNNLESTYTGGSSISSEGEGSNVVLFNNNANFISLSSSNGGTLLVEGNSAEGAIIKNNDSFILLKGNYANGAEIENSNKGKIVVDGNSVEGAAITNDDASINLYHNIAKNTHISNVNGGTIIALGNNISDSEITNAEGTNFTIGDCNDEVCKDNVGTTANNITLNNNGNFYFSGNLDLSGSTINNGGLVSGTDNIIMTDSNVYNNGMMSLSGDISLNGSSFENTGTFTLSDSLLNLSGTDAKNSGVFIIKNVDISGGAFKNTGALKIDGDNSTNMDITNTGRVIVNTGSYTNLNQGIILNEITGSIDLYNNTRIVGDLTNFGILQLVSKDDSMVESIFTGDINNYATLSLSSSADTVGNTLTIDGNYIGYNGSKIVMNSILSDDTSRSDKLLITGNSDGESSVYINNLGGHGAQTVEGINVITVNGNSGATFTKGSRIVAGAYDYSLVRGVGSNKGNWYLTSKDTNPTNPTVPSIVPPTVPPTAPSASSQERPEAGSYISNAAAANTLFTTRIGDRSSGATYRDSFTGEQKNTLLWMRNVGGHTNWHTSSGQLKTKSNQYVVQIGGDIKSWKLKGADRLSLGLMTGYGTSKSRTHSSLTGYSSKGNIHGYSAGLYGTWFEDVQKKSGLYIDSWALYNWFDNSVKGDQLTYENYRSKGITASVEVGYSIQLNNSPTLLGEKYNWYLQPNAQVTWMGVKSKEHTEDNGTRVIIRGNGNIQSRLGAKTYIAQNPNPGQKTYQIFRPYIETNWVHNTNAFSTSMDGERVSQSGTRNMGEVRVGAEGDIIKNINIWGNIGTRFGSNNYNSSDVALGIKYEF